MGFGGFLNKLFSWLKAGKQAGLYEKQPGSVVGQNVKNRADQLNESLKRNRP